MTEPKALVSRRKMIAAAGLAALLLAGIAAATLYQSGRIVAPKDVGPVVLVSWNADALTFTLETETVVTSFVTNEYAGPLTIWLHVNITGPNAGQLSDWTVVWGGGQSSISASCGGRTCEWTSPAYLRARDSPAYEVSIGMKPHAGGPWTLALFAVGEPA